MSAEKENPKNIKERNEAYKKILRESHNFKDAVRNYSRGNTWAEENARAAGNL